ncbi:MAG TPA: ATP-binding protein [Geobacterales bacterium]|nr:ATP-binding protein [Geobacterales bacterium]
MRQRASALITLLFPGTLLAADGEPYSTVSTRLPWSCALFFLLVSFFLAVNCRRRRVKDEQFHRQRLDEIERENFANALRYKSLLEDAGDAILVISATTGLLEEMNRKGSDLLGYVKDELLLIEGRQLVATKEQRKFASLVRRVRERGMARSSSMTFLRKDGGTFQAEITARLIDLDEGSVVQVIVRDVTHRQRTEREMRQHNRELTILNNLIARANEDLQLQSVLDVTLAEVIEVFLAHGGCIHLLDNETLRLSASAAIDPLLVKLLDDDESQPLLTLLTNGRQVAIIPDLSANRSPLASHPLAASWKGFAGVPLVSRDRLVGIMYLLSTTERHFSHEESKLLTTIGSQIGTIIANARLFEELNWNTEELLRSHRLLEKSSHRLALSQDRLRKNLELVEKANSEMEHLDRMKSHFLGMISHEFRTPLTAIMGGAQFLLAEADRFGSDEQRLLQMIHDGGSRLNEIVSDLLKLIKLETRNITLTRSHLKLADIFDHILLNMNEVLSQRQIKIRLQDLSAVPYFSGDREYLEDIFAELLENAVKFSPDNQEIIVAARTVRHGEMLGKHAVMERFHPGFFDQMRELSYLEVEVRDSGVGIDYDDQLRVFDKFYEVGDIAHHSSSKHKFQGKGAGLGLAIVKGMVEAHGGVVWVESSGTTMDNTGGSSFFILLPLEESAKQPVFSFMEPEPTYDANGTPTPSVY